MNRMYKKTKIFSLCMNCSVLLLMIPALSVASPETEYKYLSGRGKDDAVDWDFFCTEGRQSGRWTKIPVPSQWELLGFGNYNYGHNKKKHKEQGKYKHVFSIPEKWKNRRIRIVFEGVMTDTEVLVNGRLAGPVHQGGFYQFAFDITELVKTGENFLEVNVSKVSANSSVEQAERKADYWVFGGIYRPVYLEALPEEFIDWISVDARADGSLLMDVFLENIRHSDRLKAQVLTLDGEPLGRSFSADIKKSREKIRLSSKFTGHKLWTAESPDLYKIKLELCRRNRTVHSVTRRFGFRTFEVKPGDGLYLNGRKIRLKGVNRHCFWPDSGRCLNRELSYADVRLIKEMNMNAVRMSHYPPDTHFLEACDELGLYVLDELAGWQKPSYDTETAERLIRQMIRRDQMHPCILFWDNGNEGGWNTEVDDEFAKYDLQRRRVLHPWANFGGVDTDHYEKYASVQKLVNGENLYMPTEFLHGLYDGGHGAGLNDYWKLLGKTPLGAGGFLWCFCDEGVVRTDKDGMLDVDGNHAPDGIVGPYREKEGSFYTIREILSPVQLSLDSVVANGGILDVENCYDFRNLNTCTFNWKITGSLSFNDKGSGELVAEGFVKGPSVQPGKKGKLKLPLPDNLIKGDILQLTAFDVDNSEIFSWSCNLRDPEYYLKRAAGKCHLKPLGVEQDENTLRVSAGSIVALFNRKSGLLKGILKEGRNISLADGPRVVHRLQKQSQKAAVPELEVSRGRSCITIEVADPGRGFSTLIWKMHAEGFLEMSCSYQCRGTYNFHGITFDYPESKVNAKRWLGDGPYRVWKNRLRGPQFGLWELAYNNSVPGHIRDYPAFKGYFANINWLELKTREGPFTVVASQPHLFMRLFDPGDGPKPAKTGLPSFEGDLSFLHAIPAIGTKFIRSRDLGPESRKAEADGEYEISLCFFF
ncbi:MAG: glycoside hydrolase family 2 TIM barrel-domain containing protein [Kiritimatiellia bacterium]